MGLGSTPCCRLPRVRVRVRVRVRDRVRVRVRAVVRVGSTRPVSSFFFLGKSESCISHLVRGSAQG